MPIRFRCPECRQVYSISSKKAGTKIACQQCGARMKIPALPTTPEERSAGGEARTSKRESTKKPADESVSPELAAAFDNLLDDDDYEDVGVDDKQPASDQRSSFLDDKEDDQELSFIEDTGGDEIVEAASEDDLDAVLAFERELEEKEGGQRSSMSAPLPDELFATDEEDDDDDFFGGGSRFEDEEMDLTPMVDVTFLLLIFFMITASFSIQKTLEVPAPDPDDEGPSNNITLEDIEETSIEIEIDARNVIYFDDEPISDPRSLPDRLRASGMTEVLIKADEASLHEMTVIAVDAANEAQMQKIRLMVSRGGS